ATRMSTSSAVEGVSRVAGGAIVVPIVVIRTIPGDSRVEALLGRLRCGRHGCGARRIGVLRRRRRRAVEINRTRSIAYDRRLLSKQRRALYDQVLHVVRKRPQVGTRYQRWIAGVLAWNVDRIDPGWHRCARDTGRDGSIQIVD